MQPESILVLSGIGLVFAFLRRRVGRYSDEARQTRGRGGVTILRPAHLESAVGELLRWRP